MEAGDSATPLRYAQNDEVGALRYAQNDGERNVILREVTRGIHAPHPCGAALRAAQIGYPAKLSQNLLGKGLFATMECEIDNLLERTPLIALVQAEDAGTAVSTSRALATGGITVIEVLFRTDAAPDCLDAVAREVPEAVVGAGTVLSAAQAEAALEAGAKFIVSPGLDEGVVDMARSAGAPIYPGVCTATELQRAYNLGLETVKFFPASVAGGIPALKALSSVFRTMRFIPTGGVSPANLADFLAIPAVLACGGSWLTPANLIREGDFKGIGKLAREAVSISGKATGNKEQ